MARPDWLPDFQNPPLGENAIGVQFTPPRGYTQIMAGDVWQLFKTEFPTVQETPSSPPNFETFGPVNQQFNFGIIQGPVYSRFLFISDNQEEVVQFQHDRLFHNWRKFGDGSRYPRFEHMFASFSEELNRLNEYFIRVQGSPIAVNQTEIIYVNSFPQSTSDAAGSMLRFLSFRKDEADDFVANFRRVIYDEHGKPQARLICETNTGTDPQGQTGINMTLTVRGAPTGTGIGEALEFLAKSREIAVSAFAELTTDSAHRTWGRIW